MAGTVTTIFLTEMTSEQALAIGELLAKVWVKPEKDAAYRAEQLLARAREYAGSSEKGAAEKVPRSLVILDDQKVIAHALVFERIVETESGPMSVLALALVGTDTEYRGQGLGAKIVRAAFDLVDQGLFATSLFQTSDKVAPFYEGLGACKIENAVVNSHDVENPTKNPFADALQMRYPATADWPTGTIDLCGSGY